MLNPELGQELSFGFRHTAGVVAAAARVLPAHLARAAGDGGGVRAGSLAASAAAALRAFSSVRATPQRLQLAAALLTSAVVVAAAYQNKGDRRGRKQTWRETDLEGGKRRRNKDKAGDGQWGRQGQERTGRLGKRTGRETNKGGDGDGTGRHLLSAGRHTLGSIFGHEGRQAIGDR
ncbi:Protein of unknown function [Gryllus bimaculatus]|nr:Protein of unknown function [Gryllus bimaculatus]